MPNLAAGHDKFWRSRGNAPPPPAVMVPGAYPPWQSSVICGAIFGPPLDRLAALWRRISFVADWAWHAWWCPESERLTWRLWLSRLESTDPRCLTLAARVADTALDAERVALLHRTCDVVMGQPYGWARHAVRTTATTLGFTESSIGLRYKHVLEANAGRRDNLLRHVRAVELLRAAAEQGGVQISFNEADFVIELAYQGFCTQDEREHRRVEPRTIMAS